MLRLISSPPRLPILVAITSLLLLFAPMADAWCIGKLFNNTRPPQAEVMDLFVINNASHVELNVPPRYMWGWGGSLAGYCGSMSLQSSALYFGTWISEQYPRWAAQDGDTEILIGDDSAPGDFSHAGDTFRLAMDHFDTNSDPNPQADLFLQWVQAHVTQGHVVIGGLYAQFHSNEADPYYDHIVPITGITMGAQQKQYANDSETTNITGVIYNDLYEATSRVLSHPLAASRQDFILPDNATTTLPLAFALPKYADFGLAVTGVVDTFGETYRTKLTPWSWTEPDWGTEDGCNEIPALLNISIAVYGLTPGRVYSILRFDGNTSIPKSNFLGSRSYTKRWDFVARSSTYVQSPLDTIMTNTVMSYRTVASDAQNVNITPTSTKTRTVPIPVPTTTPSKKRTQSNTTSSVAHHFLTPRTETSTIAPSSPQPSTPLTPPRQQLKTSTAAPSRTAAVLESPTITINLISNNQPPSKEALATVLALLLNETNVARLRIDYFVGTRSDRTVRFAFTGPTCMLYYRSLISLTEVRWLNASQGTLKPENKNNNNTPPLSASHTPDPVVIGLSVVCLVLLLGAWVLYVRRRSEGQQRRHERDQLLQREP